MSQENLKKAVCKCLSYAKVFEYPLSIQEIKFWLVSESDIENQQWLKNKNLDQTILKIIEKNSHIGHENSYYLLLNQGQTKKWLNQQIILRKQRQKFSQKKLVIAKQVSRWLRIIPSIEMVAVTGSLAINQANKKDDIDLMLVTSPNTLWTTRFFYWLILQILGVKRPPKLNGTVKNYWNKINNKVCPNLLLDRNHLTLSESQRDIYYAHEILQARLIWERRFTYKKFLNDNDWIGKILPRAWEAKQKQMKKYSTNSTLGFGSKMIIQFIRLFEPFMREMQVWYMASKKTRETVTPHSALFYPINCHDQIIAKYHQYLKLLTE